MVNKTKRISPSERIAETTDQAATTGHGCRSDETEIYLTLRPVTVSFETDINVFATVIDAVLCYGRGCRLE